MAQLASVWRKPPNTTIWEEAHVKKVLDERAIDRLTAVELPDRYVMSPFIVIWVDIHDNVVNVASFNDLAAALNACGNNLLSIVAQVVYCRADAEA
jgi:hypothetical protein